MTTFQSTWNSATFPVGRQRFIDILFNATANSFCCTWDGVQKGDSLPSRDGVWGEGCAPPQSISGIFHWKWCILANFTYIFKVQIKLIPVSLDFFHFPWLFPDHFGIPWLFQVLQINCNPGHIKNKIAMSDKQQSVCFPRSSVADDTVYLQRTVLSLVNPCWNATRTK